MEHTSLHDTNPEHHIKTIQNTNQERQIENITENNTSQPSTNRPTNRKTTNKTKKKRKKENKTQSNGQSQDQYESRIKILQINLNNCESAMSILAEHIKDTKTDIILYQDPNIKALKMFSKTLAWRVFESKNKTAGIIINNQSIKAIVSTTQENSVILNVSTQNNTLQIGSIYSAPSSNFEADMECLDSYNNNDYLLLGGDFNCKIPDLGYSYMCHRGRHLMEIISAKQLTLLNDTNSAPTFFCLKDKTPHTGNPDLTLLGNGLLHTLESWTVDYTNPSGSDHRYINTTLNLKLQHRQQTRYKTKHANFNKFNKLFKQQTQKLMDKIQNANNQTQLDEAIEYITNTITSIADKTLKKKSFKYQPHVSWWNKELRAERNKVKALQKRYLNTADPETKEHKKLKYKKALAQYKLNIKKSKINSWKKYCTNCNKNYGTLFKILRNKFLKPTDLIHTVLENSYKTETYDGVQEHLIRHHFDTANNFQQQQHLQGTHLPEKPPDITKLEIQNALKTQNLNKAPGPDNIDGHIIKNLITNFYTLMKKMFQKCLDLNYFPSAWKIAEVIFFHKANKDPKYPASYRPICLLPMLGKLYERIIKTRLTHQLETNKLLHNNQFGFRTNRSTSQLINLITKTIKTNTKTNKYCALISFDIQGAFDNINWETLDNTIDKLNINDYLKNTLKSFKNNRKILHKIQQHEHYYNTYKGCPQGSCLGPTLWLLIADEILKEYAKTHPWIWAFADDFVVICQANTRAELEQIGNALLALFQNICNTYNLTLSQEKTQIILFGTSLEKRHPIFKLNNKTVKIVKTLKYLGLTIDPHFNWTHHLNKIHDKISIFSAELRKIHNTSWGIKKSMLKLWYETVLEKQIDYGAEIWYPDLNSKGTRKLPSIQRTGLLAISGAYRSTATDTLLVLLGIPPLYIRLKTKAIKFKIKQGETSYTKDGITLHNTNIDFDNRETLDPPHEKLKNLTISSKIEDNIKDNIYIYTDGSKMETGTAMAFTVKLNDNFIYDYNSRLRIQNTIYQAETLAIQKAIKWATLNNLQNINIYSDSQSAILSLLNLKPKSKLTLDTLTLIKNNPHLNINITWIKGHSKDKGNDRADHLAKLPLLNNYEIDNEKIPYPPSYLNKLLKQEILTQWQDHWNNSNTGRATFNFIPKVSHKLIHEDTIVFYFISGHGSFPTFLFRINKHHTNLCDCGREGSPLHYVFDHCPLMPHTFKRNRSHNKEQSFMNLIKSESNMKKLRQNYKTLDTLYSFKK